MNCNIINDKLLGVQETEHTKLDWLIANPLLYSYNLFNIILSFL